MGPQQHLDVPEAFQVRVCYGLQTFGPETFHLVGVMDNVPKAVEGAPRVQLLFGLAYGRHHPEAETGIGVYFYFRAHSAVLE